MKSTAICVIASCLGLCSQASGQGGIITTVAGSGAVGYYNGSYSGDGGPATAATLNNPSAVAIDASRNLFIADTFNNRIRKVSAGIITTVAGGGTGGLGDGGPATLASLAAPYDVAVDAAGNLFIADTANQRIRKVSTGGIITTVAGNGQLGYSGDGGPATLASLGNPDGIAVDASGSLFIADTYNNRIRKVSPSGIITTVAGGNYGFSGDGGLATLASLAGESATHQGVAVDVSGNLFIADTDNERIRKVSPSGIISTVAGNGTDPATNPFSDGDGWQATMAALFGPTGVTPGASGELFIADNTDNRIRKVSTDGIITTVAGSGGIGGESLGALSGDGGPATSAVLSNPSSVTVDVSGNLFIADSDNNRIRKVSAPTSEPSIISGGIVPVDSSVNTIQAGEWVSIFGSNLASSTVTWNGNFPTSLGGTSVTIDGQSAYLSYVSPTQINVQAPDDTATGPVPVVVVTTAGEVAASSVTLAAVAPSFLLIDSKHVAGIIPRSDGSGAYGGGTYDILGPTGKSLGYATVAAKPGDTVELFTLGLGPTIPKEPAGLAFSASAPITNPVDLHINNVSLTPSFAGLSGAGLYQINFTVPTGLGTGDVPLTASVRGVETQSGVVISLR